MKLPSHLYLDEHSIPYERKSFPPETEKGAASVARVLGFPERQAVKTQIFQVDTGERVLVMLGGDQSALSGHLKKAIGSRNIRMTDPEVVTETTGYEDSVTNHDNIYLYCRFGNYFSAFAIDFLIRSTIMKFVGSHLMERERNTK